MHQNRVASLLILLNMVFVVALSGCINTSDEEKNPLRVTNLEIVPGQIRPRQSNCLSQPISRIRMMTLLP